MRIQKFEFRWVDPLFYKFYAFLSTEHRECSSINWWFKHKILSISNYCNALFSYMLSRLKIGLVTLFGKKYAQKMRSYLIDSRVFNQSNRLTFKGYKHNPERSNTPEV